MTILLKYTPFIVEEEDGGITEHVEITGIHNCACANIEEYKNCPHVGSSSNPFPNGRYILHSPNSMSVELDPNMRADEFRTVERFLKMMTNENIIFQQGTHRLKGLSERVREIWQDKSLTSVHLSEAGWYKLKKFNKTHPGEIVYAQKVMTERIKEMR